MSAIKRAILEVQRLGKMIARAGASRAENSPRPEAILSANTATMSATTRPRRDDPLGTLLVY